MMRRILLQLLLVATITIVHGILELDSDVEEDDLHIHHYMNEHAIDDVVHEMFMQNGNRLRHREPRRAVCPPTNLDAPFKQQVIHIGVVGCDVDPIITTLSVQKRRQLPPSGSNETCNPNLAGYLPPIPEYYLAIMSHLQMVNNNPEILPYHLLCIVSDPSPNPPQILDRAYRNFIRSTTVPVVIDALNSQISHVLHGFLLPFSIPIVQFELSHLLEEIEPSFLAEVLVDPSKRLEEFDESPEHDLLSKVASKYLFAVGPEYISEYQIIDGLAKQFRWARIGVVVVTETEWDSFTAQGDYTRYIFAYYNQSDLLKTFQVFVRNEVNIILYYGPPNLYLNLLKYATRYDFVGPSYVWILPYYNVAFPDEYVDIWCNYTHQEVYDIKNALRGTLLLGLTRGIGNNYLQFLEKFMEYSENFVENRFPYGDYTRFLETVYIDDAVGIIVSALEEVVQDKAYYWNVSQSEVNVTELDRNLLAKKLSVSNYTGNTGRIRFTSNGKRSVSFFDIRNYVPINNSNFTVNTSYTEDPWIIQTRGCVEFFDDGSIELMYIDENGNIVDTPTIVFADGTTNVPSYRFPRLYYRNTKHVILTTVGSISIFLVTIFFYVMYIYYEDRKALLYNSNWIYREDDIDYVDGDHGIRGRLSKLRLLLLLPGAARKFDIKMDVGRLRQDGSYVQIVRSKFTESQLTSKVYHEVSLMRELKHSNVCKFYGCILDGPVSALLYEFCARGSLEDILNSSSNIDLDWVFRLSFALDAAEGMAFLHSKKLIHGRLCAKTCAIDIEWKLKIQDYSLDSLRSPTEPDNDNMGSKKNRETSLMIAPEIRILGGKLSLAGDIYSYGFILQQLATLKEQAEQWQQSHRNKSEGKLHDLDFAIRSPRTSRQENQYDTKVIPKFIKICDACKDNSPLKRPSFEEIKVRLSNLSHQTPNFHLGNSTTQRVLQAYSHKLEVRMEELQERLVHKEEFCNEFVQNYIPTALLKDMNNNTPLKKYEDTTVICVEMTNADALLKILCDKSTEKLVLTMARALQGISRSFGLHKITSMGTMWILATEPKKDGHTDSILDATNAAITILDNFSGIFFPDCPSTHPIVRIGIHNGDIVCGVIDNPVPQLVTTGKTIDVATQLMLSSEDGRIHASSNVAKQLAKHAGFKITVKGKMEIGGKEVTTLWIEEDIGNDSNDMTLPTPAIQSYSNENITIKSRMRKSTIQLSVLPNIKRPSSSNADSHGRHSTSSRKRISVAKMKETGGNPRSSESRLELPWGTLSDTAIDMQWDSEDYYKNN